MEQITLSQITVYPVKSLTGINVFRWPVTPTGLRYDRKWMVIDRDGQFLSQRRLPNMALIKTSLTDEALVLSAPGQTPLHVPLMSEEGHWVNATVWEHQSQALAVSKQADQWLSFFLKQDCQLVFQPDNMTRIVDPNYGKPGDLVAFSDGFPFLLVSENSLASLNEAMSSDLPMSRFRPNLVVTGCPGYAEDSWREISIGGLNFRLPKPCSRCSVPAVDPDTAEIGKEPLATLNRLRKWQNKVYFGQNAIHDTPGFLTVGDPVTIRKTGAKQPPI